MALLAREIEIYRQVTSNNTIKIELQRLKKLQKEKSLNISRRTVFNVRKILSFLVKYCSSILKIMCHVLMCSKLVLQTPAFCNKHIK